MSEERIAAEEHHTAAEAHTESTPLAFARLLPAVTFGLRTAALAGMFVSAGAVAFGLTGVFDDATATTHTTCCGIEDPPNQLERPHQ